MSCIIDHVNFQNQLVMVISRLCAKINSYYKYLLTIALQLSYGEDRYI